MNEIKVFYNDGDGFANWIVYWWIIYKVRGNNSIISIFDFVELFSFFNLTFIRYDFQFSWQRLILIKILWYQQLFAVIY